MPKYNHAFSIGFEVKTDNEGDKVTAQELMTGLLRRAYEMGANLLTGGDEIIEACGLPFDTYEIDPADESVMIDVRKVDWEMLRDQKFKLVDTRELEDNQEYWDAFSGIIHLIDDVQDQAARILGEKIVFGKTDNDGYTGDGGPPPSPQSGHKGK